MKRLSLRGAAVLALVFLVVAPVVFLLGLVNFLSVDRTLGTRHNWDTMLGTWDEVLGRFPATGANAAALALERRAAGLGITLSPRFTDRAQAAPEALRAFDRLERGALNPYYGDQLERVRRGRIDPPPPALLDFMTAHRQELAALRRDLIEGEVPVWESDLSRLSAAPVPNLLGQIKLHRLLVSVALAQLHAGDTAGALESIHASWSLARSLRDSPLLICQMIYLSATRLQTGALRHVRDLPGAWADRIREHDLRRSVMDALKVEGRVWLEVDPADADVTAATNFWASGSATNWLKDAATRAVRPYALLCQADVSERWRESVARLERVATPCDADLEAAGVPFVRLPAWNRLGRTLVPDLSGVIRRVARLELDRELLLRELEADASRRSTGNWPAPAGGDRSSACPDDRWVYTPTAGGLEIAFSREIDEDRQLSLRLPHRILLD